MALFHTTVLDNQIKALPTVDTASGAIATFDTDLTENLVEVKCQIVAKQASGTPSPDNPLPITTYTEMNVSHSAKNIFNKAITTNLYCDGSMVLRQNASIVSVYIPLINGATYTYKQTEIGNLARYALCNSLNEYDRFYSPINPTVNNYISSTNFTFTNSANFRYLICTIWRSTDTQTFDEIADTIQLEFGSTATAYEPFDGTTANIPFGQTVANGVLDITTGKLRVTHGYSLLNNLNWNAVGDRFYADPSNILKTDGITTNSSHYEPIANIAGGGAPMSDLTICAINRGTNDRLYIKDTRFSDVNTFVSTMGSVQIIYELATPIEIQLDSITLQALLNENNIWCDTGDTEVKFLLSVGKAIS